MVKLFYTPYIEDIYFLGEYQIKFIKCSEKSVFLQVGSIGVNADIFTSRDEIYVVFTKKVNFLFFLYHFNQ